MPAFDAAALRAEEFARLDRSGEVYLDFTGSALYPASLVHSHGSFLDNAVLGNPHSEHGASARASALTDQARTAVLAFFDADPDEYAVVFTANASEAFRLVGEAFPFRPGSQLWLTADNHNSINGVREWARSRGATTRILPLDPDLRLADPPDFPCADHPSLLAFPAQSNFSGVRHDLGLLRTAREAGWHVLLDGAAFAPTSPVSLRQIAPDFLGLSFYKMFGYPTGIGALLARHEALCSLERPWFSGGTVDYVSLAHDRHQRAPGPSGFEDGTPNFLSHAAVPAGLRFLASLGMAAVAGHVTAMTARLLERLAALRHDNGHALIALHGPRDLVARGGTVAFSVLDAHGATLPYHTVERDAASAGIALRGGCFCNPGCAEAVFGLDDTAVPDCLAALGPGTFSPQRLSACLDNRPVGALRASVGVPTIPRDLDQLTTFLHHHYHNRSLAA